MLQPGKLSILWLAVMASAGCAQQVTMSSRFNAAEVAWAQGDGTNTISGFAVLRTVGGEARTCAGLPVHIVPDSSYARERATAIYGNPSKGHRSANYGIKFDDNDPGYRETVRRTTCDGQGNFSFERVPDGTWYLTTSVVWKVRADSFIFEGGHMMERVTVRGGTTRKVALP